jgi:hypothetical protein
VLGLGLGARRRRRGEIGGKAWRLHLVGGKTISDVYGTNQLPT